MNLKTIDLEQVLMLHAFVLTSTGGDTGVRDIGRLESALATQRQDVFGTELYASVYEKAAALIRGIIADHPFVDGNKRTAMITGLVFMQLHGIRLVTSNIDLENFAVQVAVDHLSVESIATWLQCHSEHSRT